MRLRAGIRHGIVLCGLVALLGAQDRQGARHISFLTFGDVNLGRAVGQRLLEGDLEHPFALIQDRFSKAAFVFANLESQLSEQGGETQHPKFNLIFCGPPEGAYTLRGANITVVSTANNHAFDYGLKGLKETIENLRAAGIEWTGTSVDSADLFRPAIVAVESVRIGFVAYTQFVNLKGAWRGRIAVFDGSRARQAIGELRNNVDFIVASYHGGEEYVERPAELVRQHMRMLIDAGADVVIGHHPHYVQGIEKYNNKLIFYSLGNFVFYQPQREWAQKGLGVELRLSRVGERVSLDGARLLPFRAGFQPSFSLSQMEVTALMERVKRLSNVEIQEIDGEWQIVDISKTAGD